MITIFAAPDCPRCEDVARRARQDFPDETIDIITLDGIDDAAMRQHPLRNDILAALADQNMAFPVVLQDGKWWSPEDVAGETGP